MEQNNGAPPPDFRSMIPAEYKDHPTLSPYKDLGSLIKSHIEGQSLLGKQRLVRPDENSTPEQWNAFYNQIGRPEAPDKYGLKKPDDFPAGLNLPEPYLKFLGETFHKNGLTTKQAQNLFQELNGFAVKNFSEDQTSQTTARQNMQAELEQEFGSAAAAKKDAAKRAETAFLDDKSKQFLEESGLKDHPQITRLFARIGEKLVEQGTDGGGGGGGGFNNLGPAQAKVEIDAKMGDKDFMESYTNQFHPNHKNAVATMTALYAKMFPKGEMANLSE